MGNQNKMFTLKNHFFVLILIIITHVMNSKKYFSRENRSRASAMSQQDYDEKHHHLTNAQKKEIKEGRFNKDCLVELFDDDWSAFNTNKMITVPGNYKLGEVFKVKMPFDLRDDIKQIKTTWCACKVALTEADGSINQSWDLKKRQTQFTRGVKAKYVTFDCERILKTFMMHLKDDSFGRNRWQ